jgi:transketolase
MEQLFTKEKIYMNNNYIQIQKDYRFRLLNLYNNANCGHIACSLSCIDIVYAIMNSKDDSEKFILSKGHAAGALYTILNLFGEISNSELDTFYKNGTKLSAHPSAKSFNNIPFALGSLGHGFPISCGIALSNKYLQNNKYTYVLMSDGETNEGTTWEAAHFAVSNSLKNLIVFIDKNNLQGFGETKDVLGDTADYSKWNSIGFEVFEIEGHDLSILSDTIIKIKESSTLKPKLIICNTIKGKGVSYMENKLEWHYLPMNKEQFETAITSIENFYK